MNRYISKRMMFIIVMTPENNEILNYLMNQHVSLTKIFIVRASSFLTMAVTEKVLYIEFHINE